MGRLWVSSRVMFEINFVDCEELISPEIAVTAQMAEELHSLFRTLLWLKKQTNFSIYFGQVRCHSID
jgi:hypothetical protein